MASDSNDGPDLRNHKPSAGNYNLFKAGKFRRVYAELESPKIIQRNGKAEFNPIYGLDIMHSAAIALRPTSISKHYNTRKFDPNSEFDLKAGLMLGAMQRRENIINAEIAALIHACHTDEGLKRSFGTNSVDSIDRDAIDKLQTDVRPKLEALAKEARALESYQYGLTQEIHAMRAGPDKNSSQNIQRLDEMWSQYRTEYFESARESKNDPMDRKGLQEIDKQNGTQLHKVIDWHKNYGINESHSALAQFIVEDISNSPEYMAVKAAQPTKVQQVMPELTENKPKKGKKGSLEDMVDFEGVSKTAYQGGQYARAKEGSAHGFNHATTATVSAENQQKPGLLERLKNKLR